MSVICYRDSWRTKMNDCQHLPVIVDTYLPKDLMKDWRFVHFIIHVRLDLRWYLSKNTNKLRWGLQMTVLNRLLPFSSTNTRFIRVLLVLRKVSFLIFSDYIKICMYLCVSLLPKFLVLFRDFECVLFKFNNLFIWMGKFSYMSLKHMI